VKSLDAAGEREGLADVGAELAPLHPAKELRHVLSEEPRLLVDEGAPVHPDDRAALEKSEVGRELRDASAREADDEEPPLPGDAAE
jgi:hypothetical protein